MDIKLINLVNELIDELDNSDIIKQITSVKKDIYDDKNLDFLLRKYKKEQLNKYSKEVIDIKEKIISNSKIKTFRTLQYELNCIIQQINVRLTSLTNEKSCKL